MIGIFKFQYAINSKLLAVCFCGVSATHFFANNHMYVRRYAYLDGLLLSLCAAPRKSAKDTFAGSANVHRFPINVGCRLVRYQRANDGAGGSSSSSSSGGGGDSSCRDRSGSESGMEASNSGENKDHKGAKAAVAGNSEEAGGGRWEFSVESDSDSILMSAASEADRCVFFILVFSMCMSGSIKEGFSGMILIISACHLVNFSHAFTAL